MPSYVTLASGNDIFSYRRMSHDSKSDKRVQRDTKRATGALLPSTGVLAVQEARSAGLPITYVEGTNIIRDLDGKKEIIGTVEPRVPVTKKKIKIPPQ